MFELGNLLLPSIFLLLPLLLFLFLNKTDSSNTPKPPKPPNTNLPKSYPIIGHLIAFYNQKGNKILWLSTLISSSPSLTFVIHQPFGRRNIMTANPATAEHILKTKFLVYQKGLYQNTILKDLLGGGIFNVDGENWKFQRHVASHEFNTKYLRKFIATVVDTELSDRLISILSDAAKNQTVLDLQDILQRFAFDNICKISFGFLLAGRDTASAALTWFFWLLHKNEEVEEEIVKEISKNRGKKTEHSFCYEDVKDMVYTHASVCESMRLYPPVPLDTKEAVKDDV